MNTYNYTGEAISKQVSEDVVKVSQKDWYTVSLVLARLLFSIS